MADDVCAPRWRSSCKSNTLARARRKGAQDRADALWHRRSKAGPALFVAYYCGQPPGVVVPATTEDDDDDENASVPALDARNKTKTKQGAGRSRAALRRRKKKRRTEGVSSVDETTTASKEKEKDEDEDEDENDVTTETKDTKSHSLVTITVTDAPLLKAWSARSLDDDERKRARRLRSFLEAASRPLPVTARLRDFASPPSPLDDDDDDVDDDVRALLSEHAARVAEVRRELASLAPDVAPAPHDPRRRLFAARPRLSKARLRTEAPALAASLETRSADGTLARQELASTLPVLALEPFLSCRLRTNQKRRRRRRRPLLALDACASPGGKTLQLLERVFAAGGRVVANDASPARLDAMRDAVGRSGLPAAVLDTIAFAGHDAAAFPSSSSGGGNTEGRFDVVLADVPCSGDGTIRKDARVLSGWTPRTARALHGTQVRILRRALELVRPGGAVCYSTCSLNPTENEAVVAAALSAYHESRRDDDDDDDDERSEVELVDAFSHVPGLVVRPGAHDWRVADVVDDDDDDDDGPSLRWYATRADAVDAGMVDAAETLWPRPERNQALRLERCARLLPQDDGDTGGFFVASMRKTRLKKKKKRRHGETDNSSRMSKGSSSQSSS